MSLKPAIFFIVMLFVVPGFGQEREAPLFLDVRPGEDPAVVDVTEINGLQDKQAVTEYREGLEEARKGNRPASEAHLKEAIRIAPDFFNAHNSLAILFHQMSRYREAEGEYLEAQRLNPRSVAPLINLASLHIDEAIATARQDDRASRGMLNSALESLNEAFEIQPRSPLASYLTGIVYYLTGFYEESESYFKEALDSGDDRLAITHLALADVYIRMSEWDNVVAQLDAFMAKRPFHPERALIRSVRAAAAGKLGIAGK